MTPLINRYDLLFCFDVKDGNPNGDPDLDNMPRIDDVTSYGLVSDVCMKRKIRNYVELLKGLTPPYDIFIRDGSVLNDLIGAKRNDMDAKYSSQKEAIQFGREAMCAQYYDVRTFGAVMSTGEEASDEDESTKEKTKGKGKKKIKGLGVVRGPVQFTFARSFDPVNVKSHSITRCCVTKSDEDKERAMGSKFTISYGLYCMHGFISAPDAAKTGFSEEDKELLFESLINAFEHDRSSARGEMNPRALIVFKHQSHLGNARSGQLFDLVKVTKKDGVAVPEKFEDYDITIDMSGVPANVEVIRIL